jgi:hypothetical protein
VLGLEQRAASALRSIVDQYAAGEAEVVRAYFTTDHTPDEHVDVLLRQMGRELQTASWIHSAVRMLDDLEVGVDRHDFAEFLEQIAEETEHYVILADLAEWVAGRKLSRDELRQYEVYARWEPDAPPDKRANPKLPEANRMLEIAHELVQVLGQARGTQLVRVSEGGGGGAFIACARLGGDPFRERLATAMRRVLQDEIHHGPERVDIYARDWVHGDDDLATATRWLRRFMAQHLRVRNEIWRYPLSPDRMEAIDRGDVAPFDARIDL